MNEFDYHSLRVAENDKNAIILLKTCIDNKKGTSYRFMQAHNLVNLSTLLTIISNGMR